MLFLNKYFLSNIHTLKDSSESNFGLGIEKPAFQLSDDLLNLLNQNWHIISGAWSGVSSEFVFGFVGFLFVGFFVIILHIKTEVYYKYSVVLAYILEKTLATPINTSSLYVRYLPISLGSPATLLEMLLCPASV